jgi:hypothetical protein
MVAQATCMDGVRHKAMAQRVHLDKRRQTCSKQQQHTHHSRSVNTDVRTRLQAAVPANDGAAILNRLPSSLLLHTSATQTQQQPKH